MVTIAVVAAAIPVAGLRRCKAVVEELSTILQGIPPALVDSATVSIDGDRLLVGYERPETTAERARREAAELKEQIERDGADAGKALARLRDNVAAIRVVDDLTVVRRLAARSLAIIDGVTAAKPQREP